MRSQAEGGALADGGTSGPVGEVVVEKVVTVPKALDAAFLEKMRRDMEEQMKAELASKQAAALNEEQLTKVGTLIVRPTCVTDMLACCWTIDHWYDVL